MLDLEYPSILDLFSEHLDPKRTESASFLIWYLENYYRLGQEAVDAVCDQGGDKGVDGIYVNDNDLTITVMQSRISQRSDRTIGDASLREFYGTLSQFKDADAISNLITTGGDAQVVNLVQRLDILNKINTHELRGEFVSNIDIDSNGIDFLDQTPEITFVGKTRLNEAYISDERFIPVNVPAQFDIAGLNTAEYVVDAQTKVIIAPIKARELVSLHGIEDQSLFSFNVRGSLGRTQVNRDIVKSIKDPSSHKLFPLFHNGITIISQTLDDTQDKISVENYFVVNGCQSLTSLYENQKDLTDDLRILTKFIKVDINSDLSEQVTHYSNNQNGVKPRDFQANNAVQIRLQNEFASNYSGEYTFEIKRGEILGDGTVISNEEAGLYLMSFDLKEPWATHRKYQVFEEKYVELFARPEVNAARIVLCQVIVDAIEDASPGIANTLFAKYVLTKYLLLYITRTILESDDSSRQTLTMPEKFVGTPDDRHKFKYCVRRILNDVIVDLNAAVGEFGEDFDYRGRLRDQSWVKEIAGSVLSDHIKLVNRGRIDSFAVEWERASSS